VIVVTQRGGPGQGSVRHAQMDYLSATRSGGNGGYKNIVLAPASVQEVYDLVQLAFHLSDKYCNPVVILSDALVGLISETVELKRFEWEPLPEKPWAVKGRAQHAEKNMRRMVHSSVFAGKLLEGITNYSGWLAHAQNKYDEMTAAEVRHEEYWADDADLIIVAYGYASRVCKEAILRARAAGLKAGLIRPISLWPFPSAVIRDKAEHGCKILVVEDSLGQMIEDVKMAVAEKTDVHFVGVLSRHVPDDSGMILPRTVLEEIRRLL